MVDLGTLGGTTSGATGVSPSGQVVGSSQVAGNSEIHAFSWTENGGMVDLGTLGGAFSFASGVSPNGQVVGMSLIASGANHAFSWTRNSGMIDLGTLGGTFSTASGVNASGMVAGQSQIAGNTALHATVWRDGFHRRLARPQRQRNTHCKTGGPPHAGLRAVPVGRYATRVSGLRALRR